VTQRVQNLSAIFSDEPFSGEGVSLYATIGETVQYRNLRVLTNGMRRRNGWIKGTGGNHDIANAVTKTARRASVADPGDEIVWTLPAEFIPGSNTQNATFDVRRYNSHVENESDNFGTVTVPIDSSGDGDNQILGTAELVNVQIRDGGDVRIRLVYYPSASGVQPTTFTAIRTAGPTSPANVPVTVFEGQTEIEIDVPSLSDASPYTYKIQAANGATTLDVLTGIIFTADATGPTAPTSIAAEAW
jgi:hypothetical protein